MYVHVSLIPVSCHWHPVKQQLTVHCCNFYTFHMSVHQILPVSIFPEFWQSINRHESAVGARDVEAGFSQRNGKTMDDLITRQKTDNSMHQCFTMGTRTHNATNNKEPDNHIEGVCEPFCIFSRLAPSKHVVLEEFSSDE